MKHFIIILIVLVLFSNLALAISSDNNSFQNREGGMSLTGSYGGETVGGGSMATDVVDARGVVYAWVNFFLGLLGVIMLLVMVVGGVLVLTSGASDDKAKKGKKMIINAVIAFVILLLSYMIVRYLVSGFINNPGA
jgi:uncharacterized membrane protein YjfL (UPF0719 family)